MLAILITAHEDVPNLHFAVPNNKGPKCEIGTCNLRESKKQCKILKHYQMWNFPSPN